MLDQEGGDRGAGSALVGEVGIVVERSPQTVRGADAAFVLADQFPLERSKEGYLLTPPALVVEVLSPNAPGHPKCRVKSLSTSAPAFASCGLWIRANRSVTVQRQDGTSLIASMGRHSVGSLASWTI